MHYLTGPPVVVEVVEVPPEKLSLGVPGFAFPCSPIGFKCTMGMLVPVVGVLGALPLGVVGELTLNDMIPPGVVGVRALTGVLTPGVVGVVGVDAPGVSTPVTVLTVNVEGFFMALMLCLICVTLVQSRRPMPPNSFSYCSGTSGGRRIRSKIPGVCFYK